VVGVLLLQGYKDVFAVFDNVFCFFFSTLCMHPQSTSHTGITFIAFSMIMLIDQLLFSCALKLHFRRGIEEDQYFP